MAYEALQNLINIREKDNPKDASFWVQLVKIVYNFIKKRNTIKLIKQWKKIEANLPKDYYYIIFYEFSKHLFEGLNEQGLVLDLLENHEIITQDDDYRSVELFDLGAWFFKCENYKKAKKYFIKCIRKFRNSSNREDLNDVIDSCSKLAYFYLYLRNNKRKVKKIVNIVNKIIQPFRTSGALDEPLLKFYSIMSDWDNAYKVAWKLIKLYEKNQKNYLYSTKREIYFYLAFIYKGMGTIKNFFKLSQMQNLAVEFYLGKMLIFMQFMKSLRPFI